MLGRTVPLSLVGPIVAFTFFLTLVGCGSDRDRPFTIFTASSALAVVEELTAETPHVAVHGASSSTLARQIAAGARADLFIAAHPKWLDELAEKGRIDRGGRQLFARNSLVIACRAGGHDRAIDLATFEGRLAIGDPAHVPLGEYTKQALVASGRWDAVRSKILPAGDARSAVEYLLSGEAEVAVLYRTDVVDRPALEILEQIDRSLHDPIELWIVPSSEAREGSDRWLERLTSPEARRALQLRGFDVTGLEPRAAEASPLRAGGR